MAKYFSISELTRSEKAETHHIDNHPTPEAVDNMELLMNTILDPLRERFGSAIVVTSGYRCDKLNKLVKGSTTSQHRYGAAADLKAKNGNNRKLFDTALEMIKSGELKVGQLIWEYGTKKAPSWVHISLPYTKVNDVRYYYDK